MHKEVELLRGSWEFLVSRFNFGVRGILSVQYIEYQAPYNLPFITVYYVTKYQSNRFKEILFSYPDRHVPTTQHCS